MIEIRNLNFSYKKTPVFSNINLSFPQGNIYGLQVSGNEAHAAIVSTSYSGNANSLITGGDFGPEGGLAVTAVTAVCMVIVIILIARSRNLTRNKNA